MPKRKNRRGHWCWMCGRTRPNERFSGRGHAQHLCRDCASVPRQERERVRALDDIEGYFRQRHISAKNIARLDALTRFPDADVAYQAGLVLQVARIRPGRRKRVGLLIHHHRELYERLVACGLIEDVFLSDEEAEALCAGELDYLPFDTPEEAVEPEFNLDVAVAEWSELRSQEWDEGQ